MIRRRSVSLASVPAGMNPPPGVEAYARHYATVSLDPAGSLVHINDLPRWRRAVETMPDRDTGVLFRHPSQNQRGLVHSNSFRYIFAQWNESKAGADDMEWCYYDGIAEVLDLGRDDK